VGWPQYGYPISEEFYEVSPDDGGTYVVQYFERARFEWHPEHSGTPYEVLLRFTWESTTTGQRVDILGIFWHDKRREECMMKRLRSWVLWMLAISLLAVWRNCHDTRH
jgi:hypothetical protein